jgi:UV DNA damage endonuclease
MIRFGLCCIFHEQPIRFRRTTAASLGRSSRREQLDRLSSLCLENGQALLAALRYCRDHGIGDFRINSQILPLATHPELGYRIGDLPAHRDIEDAFRRCGRLAAEHGLRTTLHPDQFVLLSSPFEQVTRHSLEELRYQTEVAELVGSDVINLHGGGAYGDKAAALGRLRRRIEALPEEIRSRLSLENDDRVYTPSELLAVCSDTGVPLVYDVHHHRCLPDELSVEEATARALGTWEREPLFHLSSPRGGWKAAAPRVHDDYIDPADLPELWLSLGRERTFTIEIEAKAKEAAILRLTAALESSGAVQKAARGAAG